MDRTKNQSTFVVGPIIIKKLGRGTKCMERDKGKCKFLSIGGHTI